MSAAQKEMDEFWVLSLPVKGDRMIEDLRFARAEEQRCRAELSERLQELREMMEEGYDVGYAIEEEMDQLDAQMNGKLEGGWFWRRFRALDRVWSKAMEQDEEELVTPEAAVLKPLWRLAKACAVMEEAVRKLERIERRTLAMVKGGAK